MGSPNLIKNRYEIKDVLGRGGMGVVYKAYDTLMRREVALKTLRDTSSSIFVDLFYRECSVLSAMVHPNIIEIFDMGEYDDEGGAKPFFVMPLLPGKTLWDLIYPAGTPLAPDRCADIVSQACRGLHAAHECGLLHRDIKPRNIFVMPDDAVKLIDFGVVRLLGQQTVGTAGSLGTLHYMAPEQIQMKALSARADIFSLATVCYEALTATHPFMRSNDADTAAAVLDHAPPPASVLNPLVSRALAQAVAQAMSKDPRNRFESATAFADALQRAARNQPQGNGFVSDPQARLARAQRSFVRGDFDFAHEILEQLEAEGFADEEAKQLRPQVTGAIRRREAEVLLTAARRYFQEEEHSLALRRVSEVLDADPSHADALTLRSEIEAKISDVRIAEWLENAAGSLDAGAFPEARGLIQNSLRLRPGDPKALSLLRETERRESAWPLERREQENLYEAAQSAYSEGNLQGALNQLEQLTARLRESKAAGARGTEYRQFHQRVRADFEALQATLAAGRRLLANADLEGAQLLSERLGQRYVQHPEVRSLAAQIAARIDEREMDFRRGVEGRIASETDLAAQLHILNQAARSRSNEEYFAPVRQRVQSKLQQVSELVERARLHEEAGEYAEALEDWLCVRDAYPPYPALKEQLARVTALWENKRVEVKAALRDSVVNALNAGDNARASRALRGAEAEFEDDSDFLDIKTHFENTLQAYAGVDAILSRMGKAEADRKAAEIPAHCEAAIEQAKEVTPLRDKVREAIHETAARITPGNWRVAERILEQAAPLGPIPPRLTEAVANRRRMDEVDAVLSEERGPATDLQGLRDRLAGVLAKYPAEQRIEERIQLVDAALEDKRREDHEKSCVAELALRFEELGDLKEHTRLWDVKLQAKNLAAAFPTNPEMDRWVEAISRQVAQFEEAAEALRRDRLKDCFAICDDVLRQSPSHFLFGKLRDQANARHLELADEYMARVERWLASEPDVFHRSQILVRALDEYPAEARYQEELNQLQRELAKLDALAQKARDFEKRGLAAEALAQWRQLRNISPSYPDVSANVAANEQIIDRQQKKARAQRLVTQGRHNLANGQPGEGFEQLREATEIGGDIPELLRSSVPDLVTGARAALPSNVKLAEAMVAHAQLLDDTLRIPKDLRTRIQEGRKAEDQELCLNLIRSHQEAGHTQAALETADEFLSVYPQVRAVESLRQRLQLALEQEAKQRRREGDLEALHGVERRAVSMQAAGLAGLRAEVRKIAEGNREDEEVKQRVFTVDRLMAALEELRGPLENGRLDEAESAGKLALQEFPDHPLFKAGLAEVGSRKAEVTGGFLAELEKQVSAEPAFPKQMQMLEAALAKYPGEPYCSAELTKAAARQQALEERAAKARALEGQNLGEALREWEAIRQLHPWYEGVDAQVARVSEMRRKEKQDALDRWTQQVERAIETGDLESATTMIRQAQQQQPDRELRGLEYKVNSMRQAMADSDVHLAKARHLLNTGSLIEGGQSLKAAFRLCPKNESRSDAIGALLLQHIRGSLNSDFVGCDALLGQLEFIRPGSVLPVDLAEAVSKKRQVLDPRRDRADKLLAEVRELAQSAALARSKSQYASIKKKLLDKKLVNAEDPRVTEASRELLARLNSKLNDLGGEKTIEGNAARKRSLSLGVVVVALVMACAVAAIAYFITRPRQTSVRVHISVVPDESGVEMDGETCITPHCNFSVKPGQHVLHIQKTGYKPRTIVVVVKEGDLTPIHLNASLEPLAVPVAKSGVPSLAP